MEVGVTRHERCKQVVNALKLLSTLQHEELFKILHKNKCECTRNNNGLFVNLAWVPDPVFNEVCSYVEFCTRSHTALTSYESICDVLTKEIDDAKSVRSMPIDRMLAVDDSARKPEQTPRHAAVRPNMHAHAAACMEQSRYDDDGTNGTKLSSSSRFQVLKKRFSKHAVPAAPAKCEPLRKERI